MGFKSLNKAQLIGNLTKDPEILDIDGTKVCNFTIATNRSWVSKEGVKHEEAEFHKIVAWDKLAEICEKILSKGRQVWIEGRMSNKRYVDKKDGTEKHFISIIANDVIVLGGKESDGEITT